jgi:hypothetical protein
MTRRTLLVVAALSALAVELGELGQARAEVHLNLGAGFGLATYDPCGYPDQNCDFAPSRTDGPSPLLGIGLRERKALRNDFKLRYGATGLFLIVPASRVSDGGSREVSGSVATAIGEIGVEKGIWSIDMVMGFSRIRVTDEVMAANRVSMAIGYVGGARVNDELTFFVRADAHAMMHGDAAAVFLGLGFEWIPAKHK